METNSDDSKSTLLNNYLTNMNEYYNIKNFLLLYEGIPVRFPELGNRKIDIKNANEIFLLLFKDNKIHNDDDVFMRFLEYATTGMR
jgi:hypothetical protein